MIVTKQSLARRAVLRGLGASVALPFLDAMVPALASPIDRASKPVVRVGFVYVPNGIYMPDFTPSAAGSAEHRSPLFRRMQASCTTRPPNDSSSFASTAYTSTTPRRTAGSCCRPLRSSVRPADRRSSWAETR